MRSHWVGDIEQRLRRCILIAALLVCVGCKSKTPEPDDNAAQLSRVEMAVLVQANGDVRTRRETTAAWVPASAGLRLYAADLVQTMDASTAIVSFLRADVTARLGPKTTLRVPDQPPKITRVRHVKGELIVRHKPSPSRPRTEVMLPPGTLVLEAAAENDEPTEARVTVRSDGAAVAMEQGAGVLHREDNSKVPIAERQYIELRNDGHVIDSGELGPTVDLIAPKADETLRTKSAVGFRWRTLPNIESYQLTIEPEGGKNKGLAEKTSANERSVELESGTYRWSVRGLRGDKRLPAAPPRRLTVTIDRTPPKLSLTSPTAGMEVSGGSVLVAGHTEPDATVKVDGRAIQVGKDGKFRIMHPIPPGLTNIVVIASDDLGNSRVIVRAARRE